MTVFLAVEAMDAFELRRHLTLDHRQHTRGLSWDQLVAHHDQAHRHDHGHTHQAPVET